MSDPRAEPSKVPPPPETLPPQQLRSGCLTGVMMIVGGFLLLPGLCAVVFTLADAGALNGAFGGLVLISLAIGAIGILMISAAVRRIRAAKSDSE